MRIIKLSPRDRDFPDRASVDTYFEVTLPNRNPPGQFLLTRGRIAEDGIQADEPLIFSYRTEITHIAKAASPRLPTPNEANRMYPFYFRVDLRTLCPAQGDLHSLEEALAAATGTTRNVTRTQGWPTLTDSPEIEQIWNRLRIPSG